MAQKKTSPQVENHTVAVLIINKEDFKKEILDRIDLGEELFNRVVATNIDLDRLQTDYRSWSNFNSEYLQQVFNIGKNEYRTSYTSAGYTFMGQMGEVPNNPHLSLKNLIKYKVDSLRNLSAISQILRSESNLSISTNLTSNDNLTPKTDVFIVHGHDDLAKIRTARFITTLGFNPIILHEQSSSGKTIIEKIEQYSNVGFGIVLYTQCDLGASKEDKENLKFRARQNVVFEHGFLIGKIGRNNVCALVKDEVETPNDISGVVYVKMDEDDAWHIKIAKELRSSGYNIDMNKL